jgi:hypothetical protein
MYCLQARPEVQKQFYGVLSELPPLYGVLGTFYFHSGRGDWSFDLLTLLSHGLPMTVPMDRNKSCCPNKGEKSGV